jgi:hypothetical protein
MGNQGRSNHPGASLGWAWGVGLAGVIITVLCFLALVAFIVYIIRFYDSSLDNPKDYGEMYVTFPIFSQSTFIILYFILGPDNSNNRL